MKNFYNDPNVYCVNVAKKHGAGFPLDEHGNAQTRLLNGEWDFKYFVSATMLDLNPSEWDTIEVPSNWQLKDTASRYIQTYAIRTRLQPRASRISTRAKTLADCIAPLSNSTKSTVKCISTLQPTAARSFMSTALLQDTAKTRSTIRNTTSHRLSKSAKTK